MPVYTEPVAEVNGLAIIGQSYTFYGNSVRIKKTISDPLTVGAVTITGEEEIYIDLSDEKTQRDLSSQIGKYISLGNSVQSQLELLGEANRNKTAVSSSPPPGPSSTGDLWCDSNNGELYIYYDSFWVQITKTIP